MREAFFLKSSDMNIKASYIIALILLTLGIWLSASFLWGSLGPGWYLVLAIVAWLFLSGLVWAARNLSEKFWIYAGLFVLVVLFLPTSMLVGIFPAPLSQPLDSLVALSPLLTLSLALVIVALLLYSSLKLYREWQSSGPVVDQDSEAQPKHVGRIASIALVLGALLLAKALHNFYWFTVWDNTDDSLGYIWLIFPFLAVLFSTGILSITLPGRSKVAGILYLLLIPALLIAASALAQSVDFRHLTEQRAGLANQAIETYYAQEGRYPQNLQQLTPWYILSLPGPFIIFGQDWCYDGGDGYYRLGYVYREHWSDPRLSGQIYSTKGEVPDLHGMCEGEVAALQERYPNAMYEYLVDG
jgi:type II secretory pathway pseudopilin PulG